MLVQDQMAALPFAEKIKVAGTLLSNVDDGSFEQTDVHEAAVNTQPAP